MRHLITTALLALLLTFGISATIAQSDTDPIDPFSSYDMYASYDNIIFAYPDGMTVGFVDNTYHASFADTDYIVAWSSRALADNGFDAPLLYGLATDLYDAQAEAYADLPEAGVALIEYFTDNMYFGYRYEVTNDEITLAGYIIDVDGVFIALTLVSEGLASTPIEDQVLVLDRMINTVEVDGVPLGGAFLGTDLDELMAIIEANLQTRPLPTDLPELSQEISAEVSLLRFSVPEGWVAFTEFGLLVGSSETMLEVFNDIFYAYEADDLVFQLIDKEEFYFFGADVAITAPYILTYLYDQFSNSGEVSVYEMPEDATLPLIYLTDLTSSSVPRGAFIMVAQIGEADDDLVVIIGVGGDFETVEPTLVAIINSMRYAEED